MIFIKNYLEYWENEKNGEVNRKCSGKIKTTTEITFKTPKSA